MNADRYEEGQAVALQGDGKALVAGYSDQGPAKGGQQFALARYLG
jgi:hypothetical protein